MTDELLTPKTTKEITYGGVQKDSPVPVTDYLDPDEKCEQLVEVNRIDKTSRHVNRWEFIYVNRGGERAVHISDLGPANLYQQGEFQILSGWEDTVSELREQANNMRFENMLQRRLIERQDEKQRMIDVWLNALGLQWELRNNRSHFGPKYKAERSFHGRR